MADTVTSFFAGDRVGLTPVAAASIGRGHSKALREALCNLLGTVVEVQANSAVRVRWDDDERLEILPPKTLLDICLRIETPASLTESGHVMPDDFEELLEDVIAFAGSVELASENGRPDDLEKQQTYLERSTRALREYLAPSIGIPWSHHATTGTKRPAQEKPAKRRRGVRGS